jgi:activating signal cointegrator complex subunit 1
MSPKPTPTHFLSIQLVNASSRPQLVQSLGSFLRDVTSSFGVPEEAVRPVGTMHLTLGMFSFPKNSGLEKATELLRSLKPREILASMKSPTTGGEAGPGPLTITLRGLNSMQPASNASVLYAHPVDQLGVLQAFCEKIREAFLEAGLMIQDNRPLLLHATILNTVYVKGGRRKRNGRWEKVTINARPILDRYEDQLWVENARIEKLALSRMGAKKMQVEGLEDEAYEVEAEIDI